MLHGADHRHVRLSNPATHDRRSPIRAAAPSASRRSSRPAAAAAPRPASIRSWESGSGPQRSRSVPASSAVADVEARPVPAGDRAHVERVADRNAAEPEIAAEQVRRTSGASVAGRSVRPVSAGTARWPAMASRAPASMPAANGTSSALAQLARRPLDDRQPVVGIADGAPCPGKCLTVAATPARCSPRTDAATSAPDGRRVVAERPDPDDGVPRVRRQVAVGRVDHVHAHRPELGPGREGHPLGEVRVARRPERHRPGERRCAVAHRVELARLVVGRDQERRQPETRRGRLEPSVSARTWAGDSTLRCRYSVTPAAAPGDRLRGCGREREPRERDAGGGRGAR